MGQSNTSGYICSHHTHPEPGIIAIDRMRFPLKGLQMKTESRWVSSEHEGFKASECTRCRGFGLGC
jgi:hypothetical protein